MITANRAYELSWQLTLDLRESSVKTTRPRYIFGSRQKSIFAANFPACIGSSFVLKAEGEREEQKVQSTGRNKIKGTLALILMQLLVPVPPGNKS